LKTEQKFLHFRLNYEVRNSLCPRFSEWGVIDSISSVMKVREPSHIHVQAVDDQAKFWLEPIELAANYGFKGHELNEIKKIIEEHQPLLIEAWYEHFSQN